MKKISNKNIIKNIFPISVFLILFLIHLISLYFWSFAIYVASSKIFPFYKILSYNMEEAVIMILSVLFAAIISWVAISVYKKITKKWIFLIVYFIISLIFLLLTVAWLGQIVII